MEEACTWGANFFPLVKDAPKFFGFSDFLAASALLVLAWTISGARYQFRLETAPFSIFKLSYYSVGFVGLLTLLTDFWRAQQLCVPKGWLLTPESWQLVLASLYFLTFMVWLLFSFIRPLKFCRLNDDRYLEQFKKIIIRGNTSEMAILAEELLPSVDNIMRYALIELPPSDPMHDKPYRVADNARKLLFLISDPRFCKALVANAPDTCIAFFNAVNKLQAFPTRMNILAKNIVSGALQNTESQLYHEQSGYESGFHGIEKPFSNAIFSNHEMVESFRILFKLDRHKLEYWDARQWEVLVGVTTQTLEDYVNRALGNQFKSFDDMSDNIAMATADLYLINEQADPRITAEPLKKARIATQFIDDILHLFDEHPLAKDAAQYIQSAGRPPANSYNFAGLTTYYDLLADMIYTTIVHAAKVQSPVSLCNQLHQKIIWRCFFDRELDHPASSVIKQWVCTRIIDEINRHLHRSTYERASLLGFCWSVMGIARDQRAAGNCQALKTAVLAWTQKHYLELHRKSPKMAAASLFEGVIFDQARSRLIKPYLMGGLFHESERAELKLWLPGLRLQFIPSGQRPYQYWSLRTVTDLIQASE
ncbi:hypothetical protein [Pseudomonas sp. COW5]|uniref:hypothetical protein n=1 Tax=Pseudomonas sp. COW5 TaxID=2981253 RepID=UPI0022482E49|nr:hypothetical protein [Pseudomonas sp. COW5]MCX2541366.1 hypothetical protein [Pseudomonas sp. COW5]